MPDTRSSIFWRRRASPRKAFASRQNRFLQTALPAGKIDFVGDFDLRLRSHARFRSASAAFSRLNQRFGGVESSHNRTRPARRILPKSSVLDGGLNMAAREFRWQMSVRQWAYLGWLKRNTGLGRTEKDIALYLLTQKMAMQAHGSMR